MTSASGTRDDGHRAADPTEGALTDPAPTSDHEPTSAERRNAGSANKMLVLVIVLAAAFVQLVDVSIVNTAIPSIQRDLGASYAAVQLVLAGYQLAFACTLITAARLGDIYGRKRLFLIGMTFFTIASAVCGAAPSSTTLVLARIVQGFASGLMFPQVLSVIQVTFEPKERGKAFGIYGATIGLATILGPLLGGALIQLNLFHTDWRMIFYVNLPIGIAAVVAAVFLLGESKAPQATKLDVPGALLATVGVFLLVYPLTEGREHDWPLWMIALLVLSVPVLAAFALYERRRTRQDRFPLLPWTLFANRAFRVGALLSLVFFLGVAPFFFTFTLYIQIGHGYTALGAGLTTFIFAVGTGVASARSDGIAKRIGDRVLLIGTGMLAVGMGLVLLTVHLVGEEPHSYQFIPALLFTGLGLGLFVAPVTTIILANIKGQEAGPASGLISSVQQTGGAIGVALVGVIFFGLLGVNAATSSSAAQPALRKDLAAAGLPAPAQAAALKSFDTCFSDRSHAKDPTANPASCQRAAKQGGTPAVTAAFTKAGTNALGRNFTRTEQQTLIYEIGIYLLAFVLVTRLPKVEPTAVGRH